MENQIAISINRVSKTFVVREQKKISIQSSIFSLFNKSRSRNIKALNDINLKIKKGEVLGIIGRNGSGKSTLLSLILGAIPPDKGGEVKISGKIIRLSLGIGFDQDMSARENIYLNGSILGLTMKDIGQKLNSIIQFSGITDFIDTKIKYYSKGMKSRLAFAIAIHADADILLLDEFFGGVGDIDFKQKSSKVFQDTLISGKTIILVSHQLQDVLRYCDRVVYLKNGNAEYIGDPQTGLKLYKKDFRPD